VRVACMPHAHARAPGRLPRGSARRCARSRIFVAIPPLRRRARPLFSTSLPPCPPPLCPPPAHPPPARRRRRRPRPRSAWLKIRNLLVICAAYGDSAECGSNSQCTWNQAAGGCSVNQAALEHAEKQFFACPGSLVDLFYRCR
jgi:hypothetical protein